MQPIAVSETSETSPSRSPSALWAHWSALLLIVIAGVSVRVVSLASKPFWFDECFSVEVARIDVRNFLHLLWWREANMSLYYLLLRIWLHFGQSPFFVRCLSVILSVATLPAIFWVGRLLYDRRVGLIAAALLAFNAYSVRYSQEARSYALFLLLATLSAAFLIGWLGEPSRRNWRGYVATSVLAVYSHLYALLLIVAHWIVLSWIYPRRTDSEARRELTRAWKMIGIAVLPLLVFVAKTGAGPIRWIHRPGARDLLEFFEHLCGANSWPMAVIYAAACVAAIIPDGKLLWTRDRNWNAWRLHFLLSWLLFPVALTVLLSFARPVFLGRYMIFCLPPLLILAAAGLARLRVAWMLGLALVLVLLPGLQGVSYVYGHDFDDERDASGAATNFILDHTQAGDAIIFHIAETRVPYEFFRSLRAGENTASPNFGAAFGPEIIFPYHGPGLDYRDFTGKPTAEFLRAATASHSRVWVMLMNNGTVEKPDPTTVMLKRVLLETFPKQQVSEFSKVEVRLYSKQ